MRLIPMNGDGQLGSHFLGARLEPVEPDLANASVTCGPCPTGVCPPRRRPGLGLVAVDCDASVAGVQAVCHYAAGESFSIQIHILEAPAAGFRELSGYMRWDEAVFEYVAEDVSRVLDSCNFTSGYTWSEYNSLYGGLVFGCLSALPNTEAPLNNFVGPFVESQFRCGEGGVATAALEGLLDGTESGFGPTQFSLGELSFVPYLEHALITCG
jgi:hypothetical protein